MLKNGLNNSDHKHVASKSFQEECKQKLEVGKVYQAKIVNIMHWGLFCDIEGGTVFVHVTEASKCIFYNLEKVFKKGEIINVLITSKELHEGSLRVYASRKLADSKNKYERGEIVKVIIGNKLPKGNSFYCELTPSQTGIIDIPEKRIRYFKEGMQVFGIIKRCGPKGYHLNSIEYFY